MQTNLLNKVCTKCLCLKPIEQFDANKAHGNWCQKCYTDYFKSYNKKRYSSAESREKELIRGRNKYNTIVKPQRNERKKRLLLMMGGKCSICGYSKSAAALDFDHLDNGKDAITCRNKPNPCKSRTISHILAMNRPDAFELAIEEAKKCRILCANCHREITFPGHELNT